MDWNKNQQEEKKTSEISAEEKKRRGLIPGRGVYHLVGRISEDLGISAKASITLSKAFENAKILLKEISQNSGT